MTVKRSGCLVRLPFTDTCTCVFACSVNPFILTLTYVFCPLRSLGLMYFTYGIVFACGCSFAYQPSLVILGHYFKKRLGLVNGIVTAGSSLFTVTLPFVLSGLLERVGLQNTMRILCILMFVLVLAGFTYKPLQSNKVKSSQTGGSRFSQLFNTNIWKSVGYRIWAFGIPAALYGYFVPYVHLVSVYFLHSLSVFFKYVFSDFDICCSGKSLAAGGSRGVTWMCCFRSVYCHDREVKMRRFKLEKHIPAVGVLSA